MIRNNCSIGKDAFSLYLASFWVQFELFLMCNRNKGSFSLHYNFDLIWVLNQTLVFVRFKYIGFLGRLKLSVGFLLGKLHVGSKHGFWFL
jgi:hypothetical protein